ncbi:MULTISPECIES: hypothetical protein [Mycobacteroides]|uniref:hypothetical protein n=1 Tax=Mycobacteroides TaxID=670516 RepID=UPI0009C69621|nr:hypothetical protein [Mycobacteroides abscessus]SLG22592.1 Uncharacterised protein [Mycobacteroides abscessus subsp. abscessus]
MDDETPTDSAIETGNNGLESPQNDEHSRPDPIAPENDSEPLTNDTGQFSREYVESLRKENAGYRTKAKEHGQRLHTELVRQTGKLADPTDLPFDENHLSDPDALVAAVDALIEAKPHLKARKVTGNVGQGVRDIATAEPSILGLLNSGR